MQSENFVTTLLEMKARLCSFTAHENRCNCLLFLNPKESLKKPFFTGVGVDLDINGHQDVGDITSVGDAPSRDGGRSSSWEVIISLGEGDALDLTKI